ncbi:hypothetical protein B0T10DRAFT_573325 [Thelonectria olida]|uniref:NACHT domain-containing protein n=1 Tax=Thelonectria olida TaxID=1576542 RepID=A0A9P9ALD3_9HYPO|nr:hypothetical protein B0T10DRAFT_573325 [Thelonectria olida]
MRKFLGALKHRNSKQPSPSPQSSSSSSSSSPQPKAPSAPPSQPRGGNPSANEGPPASVEEIRGQIWNEAYDKLKEDEPSVVEAYEKILSVLLKTGGSPPVADGNTTNDIEQNAEARQAQMKALVEEGIERTKKEVNIKGKVEGGMRPIQNVQAFVSVAVRAEPSAAIAWAGITTCMEVLSNPLSEPGKNRDGVNYVCERVEWYWELALLLLDPGKVDESMAKLQGFVRRRIVNLYKQLLLYQMQSVCLYSRHWASVIVRDIFKVDDWQAKIDSIKEMEEAIRKDVNQHDSEVLKSQLRMIDDKMGYLREDVKAVESAVQEQTQEIRQIHHDEKDQECLRELHVVNPDAHKKEIEKTKGGLLKDSYGWILEHDDFRKFRNDERSQLLWIKGDPGKGKTMLLCGIIDELEKRPSHIISYFFCQATQAQCRSATSVLRSLLWLLCTKEPGLTSYVREKFDMEGKKLFEGLNVLVSLEEILADMLQDPRLRDVILIVDALDECSDDDRERLIALIIQFSSSSSAKWIVSSRNWPEIEEQFQDARDIRVALELNKKSISRAVEIFIRHKVDQLAQKKRYDAKTKESILDNLLLKANDTFLWVALVCEELARPRAKSWDAINTLASMPRGLDALYERMLKQIFTLDEDGEDLHRQILATACITYRPLTLDELRVFVMEANDFSREQLEQVIGECGSFLTVQDGAVYFVHQSAKDFLLKKANEIFPLGIPDQHHLIFRRSLDALTALERNVYHLGSPGILIDEISPLTLTHCLVLGTLICTGWTILNKSGRPGFHQTTKQFAKGAVAVRKLTAIMQNTVVEGLSKLLQDAQRFVLSHRQLIEKAPLQVYASALVFSPTNSLVRKLFEREEPDWITLKPNVEADWNNCIQTLEGHSGTVNSVAFSPNDERLASGSIDETVKIWDVASGQCTQSLHIGIPVATVAFSVDGQLLAVGERNGEIGLREPTSGSCVKRLSGHEGDLEAVVFSPDGSFLASASSDRTIKIWHLGTAKCTQTIQGYKAGTISFSRDGRQFASALSDGTFGVWDTDTGSRVMQVGDDTHKITSVAFLADKLLATSSSDGTIGIWDLETGVCTQTLSGHHGFITSVVSLGQGRGLASASFESDIRVWDATGACVQSLKGHNDAVRSLTFSPGKQLLASGAHDCTVRVWDLTTKSITQAPMDYGSEIRSLAFSPDGQHLFSTSGASQLKIWDTSNGNCIHALDEAAYLDSSPDGRWIISRVHRPKGNKSFELWDPAENSCIQKFEDIGDFTDAAFSADRQLLATASLDGTVGIWDVATQNETQRIKTPSSSSASALAFSIDSHDIAIASDGAVEIWDMSSRTRVRTLDTDGEARMLALSKHSQRLVTVLDSEYNPTAPTGSIISVWDLSTGALVDTLEAKPYIRSLAFTANGQRLATMSSDWGTWGEIQIWDVIAKTGTCSQMMNIAKQGASIRFDPKNSSRLWTNAGVLDLDMTGVSYCGYGLINDMDGDWVVKGSERMLWLPREYRSVYSVGKDSTMAFSNKAGRVLIMQFE